MAPPTTLFPTAERELYVVREATPGVIPAALGSPFPVTQFQPSDKPAWLDDGSWRGDMGDVYGSQQGALIGGFDIGGPYYGDLIGHVLYNILGDYTASGTATSPSGTTNAAVAAGATTLPVASGGANFTAGMNVWLEDAGSTAGSLATQLAGGTAAAGEIVQVAAGSTATSITLATPTRYAHNTGMPFTNTTAPYTHVFAKLNTATSQNNGAGQPVTHTFTDRTGVPATGLARQYAYSCFGELTITGSAEKLLEWSGKAVSLAGQIAASPAGVQVVSGSAAYPSWRSTTGIGGTVATAQVKNVPEWAVTIGRTVKPYFTNQGSNQPYVIARGKQSTSGSYTIGPAVDETALTQMLANTQPQLQYIAANGLTGAALASLQIDVGLARQETADLQDGDELFGYQVPWHGINTAAALAGGVTMTGATGGYGSVKVTLINNVPAY